jgi:hypothetical protein
MLVWITVAITVLGLLAYSFLASRYGRLVSTANSRRLATNTEERLPPPRPRNPYLRFADCMMAFVSLAVLCSALFVILSGRYDDASQKWAFGSVGTILGFWFRRSNDYVRKAVS